MNTGSKFFANGAAPGGVLEHPGTIKDPQRMRESWQSTFGGSGNVTVWINSPATIAWGDAGDMEKAIAMLDAVKDSIINAYEIKSGLSRAKLSHLMDSETWMDANKAVELGFADGILSRAQTEDEAPPAGSMLYSPATVVNSLKGKIAAQCRIEKPKPDPAPTPTGRSIDTLMERLNLLKF